MKEIKSAIAVSKVDEQYVMGRFALGRNAYSCFCSC